MWLYRIFLQTTTAPLTQSSWCQLEQFVTNTFTATIGNDCAVCSCHLSLFRMLQNVINWTWRGRECCFDHSWVTGVSFEYALCCQLNCWNNFSNPKRTPHDNVCWDVCFVKGDKYQKHSRAYDTQCQSESWDKSIFSLALPTLQGPITTGPLLLQNRPVNALVMWKSLILNLTFDIWYVRAFWRVCIAWSKWHWICTDSNVMFYSFLFQILGVALWN